MSLGKKELGVGEGRRKGKGGREVICSLGLGRISPQVKSTASHRHLNLSWKY